MRAHTPERDDVTGSADGERLVECPVCAVSVESVNALVHLMVDHRKSALSKALLEAADSRDTTGESPHTVSVSD